jgi:MYXO-CTERM domain-containing protein
MGGNLAGTAGATASSSSATSATASSCSCRLGGKAANPSSPDFGFLLLGLAWVGLHWRRRGTNMGGLAKHLR